jgi:hypothetical protein
MIGEVEAVSQASELLSDRGHTVILASSAKQPSAPACRRSP